MDERHLKELKQIAKKMGGIKVSQLIRLAISEFIVRHKEQEHAGN
jgi:metal-responsive CopG/Arc/MetJ family transcriptional regulator